ncbi:MAG: Surface polysaccharide O-acyltransferase, integral rane enzyme, partial [Aeromicrobium sp.]|nr:Surface polysaccharide O-acyltransferase, integral rane enzyme [Aeromicrobium sp.]
MTESRAHPAAETAAPVRVYYFDYLRVWATVGVVTLHSAWLIILARQDPKIHVISQFNVANIYDSMGRFAVSCFFMISGALLLDPGHRFRLRQ